MSPSSDPPRPSRPRRPSRTLRRADAARPRDRLQGRVIGRCRLEERIAGGKTAAVYRAHHTALDTYVAVKVLRPAAAALPHIVQGFATEARAIARIDSENVLKIYDVFSEGDLHGIVMEFLEGESVLDLLVRQGRLSLLDALRILRQAANGLAAAHARGIVHRDVKPQNLVILPDGTVKLVDFGLAAEGEGDGRRLGTPHYMAPETCETGRAEPGSDMYSLGVVLFHMLVGQPPFAGRTVGEVLRAHMEGQPLRLEEACPGIEPQIADILRDLTKGDPLLRPSAPEVVEALDRFGGRTLRDKAPLRRRRRAGRRGARSLGVRIAAGVLLAGALAAAAFLLLGRDPPPAPEEPAVRAPPPAPLPVPDPPDPPRTAAQERAEQDAREVLAATEAWARANWTSRADTEAVVGRYLDLRGAYPGTEAALEADRRAREIRAGRLHPHPDRAWTAPEKVEATRAAWEEVRPEVRALLAAHRYDEARALVPAPVEDPPGDLEAELRFREALLDRLVEFPAALDGAVGAASPPEPQLVTSRGSGVVLAVRPDAFVLRLEGSRVEVGWAEVEAAAVADLAASVLREGAPRALVRRLAFCFAHGLEAAFWQADLDLGLAGGAGPDEPLVREMKARPRKRPAPR